MADRLKQIWNDFSNRTSVHLTAIDIDGVARPSRDERMQDGAVPRPSLDAAKGEASDAVRAAFSTLHADIQAKAKRAKGRRKGSSLGNEHSFEPPLGLDKRLLSDLHATEIRVKRPEKDYLTYAHAQQDAWKRRRRKKFLGIF